MSKRIVQVFRKKLSFLRMVTQQLEKQAKDFIGYYSTRQVIKEFYKEKKLINIPFIELLTRKICFLFHRKCFLLPSSSQNTGVISCDENELF